MRLILLALAIGCSAQVFAASWQITYPRALSQTDIMTTYPITLLSVALEQTGVNYQLSPSDNYLTKVKALNRLQDNREVNLVWSMTNEQREESLLPIRIPIFKGLIGWRLLMIRQDMAERFEYIQSLEHLLKLSPIQGRDWPDTKILQSNGFDVAINQGQNSLLNMLLSAQGDFYPRSVVEIWHELEVLGDNSKLIAQPSLGIRYPAAVYFFVNKSNRPLANLIEVGLEKAIENGKFDALFLKHYQQYIGLANFKNRTFYHLENAFLPSATPMQREELWFDGKAETQTPP